MNAPMNVLLRLNRQDRRRLRFGNTRTVSAEPVRRLVQEHKQAGSHVRIDLAGAHNNRLPAR